MQRRYFFSLVQLISLMLSIGAVAMAEPPQNDAVTESRCIHLAVSVDEKKGEVKLLKSYITWNDSEPEKAVQSKSGYELELLLADGSSIVAPCSSPYASLVDDVQVHSAPVFARFFTEKEAVGIHFWSTQPRKLMGKLRLSTMGSAPQIALTGNLLDGLDVKLSDPAHSIYAVWSDDGGKTWKRFDALMGRGKELKKLKIAKQHQDVMKSGREILVEVQAMYGLNEYRERFVLNGTIKKLAGKHPHISQHQLQ